MGVREERSEVDDGGLPPAPDGGWGWVVCVGSFVVMFVLDGVLFSFGVFFLELLEYFRDARGKTALVGSTLMGMSLLAGPLVSALVNQWGCRVVTIGGALVSSGAFIVSIWVPSVDSLIVTYGIIGGFGFSMAFLPPIIMVGLYFERHRALASGLAMCGSGVGVFVFAPLCTYLQDNYTWRGGTLILSGLLLNCCVCGALFRPLTRPVMTVTDEVTVTKEDVKIPSVMVTDEDGGTKSLTSLPVNYVSSLGKIDRPSANNNVYRSFMGPLPLPLKHRKYLLDNERPLSHSLDHIRASEDVTYNTHKLAPLKPLHRSDIFYSGSLVSIPNYRPVSELQQSGDCISLEENCERCIEDCQCDRCACVPEGAKGSLSVVTACLRTCSSHMFWLYAVSATLWTTQSTVMTFLPPYAVSRGVAKGHAALLISAAGITNTFGRVMAGWLADRPQISCIVLNACALLTASVVTLLVPFTENFWLMVVESAMFGLCMATWVTLRPIVLVALLGISQLTNSLGFVAMFQGVAFSMGPPLAGLLHDHTDSYHLLFSLAAAMFFMSGILSLFLARASMKQRRCQNHVTSGSQPLMNKGAKNDRSLNSVDSRETG